MTQNSQANDHKTKTKYDSICKGLLARKNTLARIMQSCLPEYQNCSLEDIANKYIEGQPEISTVKVLPENSALIDGMANEDTSPTEGTVFYDIRYKATAPENDGYTTMILNIEAQADFYPGYPLIMRGIYYCSRMLSAQYGREFVKSEYQNLKKVVSIWICTEPPKERANTINKYHMTEDNVLGDVKEPVKNYDLLSVIMLCLANNENSNENNNEKENEDNIGILKYLSILLSKKYARKEKEKILEEQFGDLLDPQTKGDLDEMCNLGQAIENKAMQKGFEKGIAQGIEKGIEKGIAQGIEKGIERGRTEATFQTTLANIQSLMYKVNWTAEQAMDALNIPQAERRQYLPKLKYLN